MKQRLTALVCALALLAGCTPPAAETPPPAEPAAPAKTELTQEEIHRVNEAFAPMEERGDMTWATQASCFFTSFYHRVEALDFTEFLWYFPGDGSREPVDGAELAALAALPEFPWTAEDFGVEELRPDDLPVPVHRIRRERVDAALTRYAGITTAELEDTGDVPYLEEYDAFYTLTSDVGPGVFTCVGGEWDEDGARLWGRPREEGDRDVLTLRCEEGKYFIQSFLTESGPTLKELLSGLEGEDIGRVPWTGTGEAPTEQELADMVRAALKHPVDSQLMRIYGWDTDVIWRLTFYLGDKDADAWAGDYGVYLSAGLEEDVVELSGGLCLPSGRVWVKDEALYQLVRTQNDREGYINDTYYQRYRDMVDGYYDQRLEGLRGAGYVSWELTEFMGAIGSTKEEDKGVKVFRMNAAFRTDPPELAPDRIAGGAYVDSQLRAHGLDWYPVHLVTIDGEAIGLTYDDWLDRYPGEDPLDHYTQEEIRAMVAQGEECRGGDLIGSWEREVVSDGPGATLIRYTAPDENGTPQVKLEVAAMTEEHDLDGGGDMEIVVYHTGRDTRGIGIYDLAYGELVCLDVNEVLGCQASDYTGNIGNIRREYSNCVEAFFTDPDGRRRTELYRYTPARRLEYVCPLEEALLKT